MSSLPLREPSPRVKLLIAYDGRAYNGWQVQKIGLGVQAMIEGAMDRLFGSPVRIHGSSRTDTGVHARGMVAHFDLPPRQARIAMPKLTLALNAHLPEDIRIVTSSRTVPWFHARFHALGKQYRYFLWNHPAMDPITRLNAWHVPKALDAEAIRKATGCFVGRHDFASFAGAHSYQVLDTVRTISHLSFQRRGPAWTFIIEGDGFLYKMCRGIVGTLVQVGLGKISPDAIPAILESKDRSVAGMTAPAHGLVLWKVKYPKKFAPVTPKEKQVAAEVE